jgi:hypothetical protein
MKTIQLTRGKEAVVSDKDYAYLNQWKWSCSQGKYAVRTIGRRSVRMHRVVASRMGLGRPSQVDHKDRDGLNNQRRNLRRATKKTNGQNRGPNKNNSTGLKGIHQCGLRWRAQISVGGKRIHLGRFDTQIEAAAAYNVAAKKHHKQFAWQNLI